MSPNRSTPRSPALYPSKRDAWIVVLLWIGVGTAVFGVLQLLRVPGDLTTKVATIGLSLAAAAFMLWMLYGTSYTISDERLVIRSGPFRWRIALDAIQSVEPTHSPFSSPAVSLDRLRIRYGPSNRSVVISPDEKARFLRDLATRASGLRLRGDRIEREA